MGRISKRYEHLNKLGGRHGPRVNRYGNQQIRKPYFRIGKRK